VHLKRFARKVSLPIDQETHYLGRNLKTERLVRQECDSEMCGLATQTWLEDECNWILIEFDCRPREATRMKPGERGEGEIDVPNFAWTSFWRRKPREKSRSESAIVLYTSHKKHGNEERSPGSHRSGESAMSYASSLLFSQNLDVNWEPLSSTIFLVTPYARTWFSTCIIL
jgi:hypothetical protein